jgi:hypothetical protein
MCSHCDEDDGGDGFLMAMTNILNSTIKRDANYALSNSIKFKNIYLTV